MYSLRLSESSATVVSDMYTSEQWLDGDLWLALTRQSTMRRNKQGRDILQKRTNVIPGVPVRFPAHAKIFSG